MDYFSSREFYSTQETIAKTDLAVWLNEFKHQNWFNLADKLTGPVTKSSLFLF
jgi:hypothetical protein